jgi:hypothetical protein
VQTQFLFQIVRFIFERFDLLANFFGLVPVTSNGSREKRPQFLRAPKRHVDVFFQGAHGRRAKDIRQYVRHVFIQLAPSRNGNRTTAEQVVNQPRATLHSR